MKRRRKDSGFAMLLVFLMAACVAITLYVEVPRVAFQAERQRESMLVDRGNQFKRAIQVFVTDKINNPTHRYPASIDEMESFNNHRYLRRRYLDPMTGKDEWRLVHINGGVLTDSVTTQAKPAGGNGQSGSTMPATGDYLSQQASLDPGEGASATGGVTRAMNRRPSDGGGAPSDPNNPGALPGMPGDPNGTNPNGSPSTNPNGSSSSIPGAPGANPNGFPGIPGQSASAGQQQAPPPCASMLCPPPPTTASGTPAGQSASGMPAGMQQPGGISGAGFNGQQGNAQGNSQSNAQSAAASMIGNLLTTPRPGGMPSNMPGATIGGGIAGVASKYQAEGIMVINQRTKINEWEYIFDQTKYRAPPNPVSGTAGTPQQQGAGANGNSPTTPGAAGTGSGLGSPGLGSSGSGSTGSTTGTTGH
jgi:type II secretory pathway pseudopilin PulG